MNQVNKEHQEWVNARQEEEQAKRAVQLVRLKTAGLVVTAFIVGWFLYRHVLGSMAIAPAIGLVLLAYRWNRAFPARDTGDAALAGALYRWTYSKPFRSDARYAFKSISGFFSQFLHVQGRLSLTELMAKKHDAFLQDLPDIKRLADDRTYASQAFRRATITRLIPLLSLDVLYHLALIVVYPPFAAWCVLAAVLTGIIAVPVARAGALGNLDHFMQSYGWLHVYLSDTTKQDVLTAAGLSEAIKENA